MLVGAVPSLVNTLTCRVRCGSGVGAANGLRQAASRRRLRLRTRTRTLLQAVERAVRPAAGGRKVPSCGLRWATDRFLAGDACMRVSISLSVLVLCPRRVGGTSGARRARGNRGAGDSFSRAAQVAVVNGRDRSILSMVQVRPKDQ